MGLHFHNLNYIKWKIKKIFLDLFKLSDYFYSSTLNSYKYKAEFKNIRTFCLFIGTGRSGHSLIGSILDAHKNIVISHQLNILKYFRLGFSKTQLFYLILRNSQYYSKTGRMQSGYSYFINQNHGKYEKLVVIGDKRGGGSTDILKKNIKLIDKFKHRLKLPVKIIYVKRNPYDIITTTARKGNKNLLSVNRQILENNIKIVFNKIEVISKIRNKYYNEILEFKHEDFLKFPKEKIIQLCNFLEVNPDNEYIIDCCSIIKDKPHKSRFEINWPNDLIDLVKQKINEYEFLNGYSYNS